MQLLATNPALSIALILALGAAAQWLAWRMRLPAILPLLVTGFVVGPVLGLLDPEALLGEQLLHPTVSLAVGLILFEGGLTLRIPELREVRGVVVRLVTVGAAITWVLGALAAHWIVGLPWAIAALFGALIIVTGPTVIGPLLRIVRPSANVGNVLKWEGILIDAIGAMAAVLAFEVVILENRGQALPQVLLLFTEFILVGSLVGIVAGVLLAYLLRRRLLPDYLVNLSALAFVFGAFALSNSLAAESGLLATVLMGVIVTNLRVPNIHSLLTFKEDLTVLFISLLFIVLAANIELEAFLSVLVWPSFALLLVVMLLIRPLNVFVSAIGSPLKLKEKLYLSWIAPRGIVAAAVSSLFASRLVAAGFPGSEALVPLVFMVIVGTVLLNSLTARRLGTLLGIADPNPDGFLILGAHPFARRIATFLQDEGLPVMLADTNWANVAAARVEGLPAYYGSLLSDQADDEIRLGGIGRLLALTSNDEANALTALKYAREFGTQSVFQLEPQRAGSERDRLGDEQRGRVVFRRGVTYNELESLVEKGAKIKKTDITERFDLADFERLYGDYLPMFVIQNKQVKVLTEGASLPEPGATLVSVVLESPETPAAAPAPAEERTQLP